MPETVDIKPLVRMIIAGVAGVETTLAIPALQAALCEVTRVQFNGDSTSAALTIIEETLGYYRTQQRPLEGLTIDDTAKQETH